MPVNRGATARGLAVVVAAALLGGAPGASARPHAARVKAAKPAKDAAERVMGEGEAALKAGDLAGAERLLGEAYRAHGTPQALFLLGRVALAQGRAVAAQDLLRRYLAATEGQGAPPAQQAEVERALAPALPAGEVVVLGAPGARVLLDGRLVALLPLPLPLLVTPEHHEVRLEFADAHAGAPLVATLDVKAERRVEVRFERATAAVIVSALPTVLLLMQGRGAAEPAVPRLQQAIVERLRGERLTVLPAKPLATDGCTEGARCQLAMLTQRALDYALVIEVEASAPAAGDEKTSASAAPATPVTPVTPVTPAAPAPAAAAPALDFHVTVSLLDAEVGEVAARAEQRCTHCTLEALATQVAAASSEVAAQGLGRRRGKLAVSSDPPGAQLELSGRIIGPTPYHGVRFAGTYAAVLRHPGYRELSQTVVVAEGKPAELRVQLEPQLTVPLLTAPRERLQPVRFVEQGPRPLWRLVLGGGLIGGGALTAGFGGGALAIDGQCLRPAVAPAQQCNQHYQTSSLGLGLVSAGAAVSLLGVVLLAIPGPRRAFTSTVTLAPCATSGAPATGPTPLCAKPGGR